MTAGDKEEQEHAVDDEGIDKEGKGSKVAGDGDKGGRRQRDFLEEEIIPACHNVGCNRQL